MAFTDHVRNVGRAGSSFCRFGLRWIGLPADLSWGSVGAWDQWTVRHSMQTRKAAYHVHDLESRRNRAVLQPVQF